jgi:beta-phosphoglucomutase-like phosphatase (HAD superfamily)
VPGRRYTSELPHIKPHPEAFRAALDGLGVTDPTGVVMVGDRPIDDIDGAHALGMRTVWRRNHDVPAGRSDPDAVITELGRATAGPGDVAVTRGGACPASVPAAAGRPPCPRVTRIAWIPPHIHAGGALDKLGYGT